MSIRRFFCSEQPQDGLMTIMGEEVHHITAVNRLRVGSKLEVTNGQGWVHQARIETVERDRLRVNVLESHFTPRPSPGMWLAISMLKGKAMNFVIERLTEIGVDRITPVLFNRTDVSGSDDNKALKWYKIAEQAIKVNDNPWLPMIDDPVELGDFLKSADTGFSRVLLDLEGSLSVRKIGNIALPVLFLIGPPGGICERERSDIKLSGFMSARICQWTLRSETAAMVAAAWILTSLDREDDA